MFTKDKNKKLCEEILKGTAKRHDIQILEINILPDHIHLAISIPPTMSIARAFQFLKGAQHRLQ
jgi:putative transposase